MKRLATLAIVGATTLFQASAADDMTDRLLRDALRTDSSLDSIDDRLAEIQSRQAESAVFKDEEIQETHDVQSGVNEARETVLKEIVDDLSAVKTGSMDAETALDNTRSQYEVLVQQLEKLRKLRAQKLAENQTLNEILNRQKELLEQTKALKDAAEKRQLTVEDLDKAASIAEEQEKLSASLAEELEKMQQDADADADAEKSEAADADAGADEKALDEQSAAEDEKLADAQDALQDAQDAAKEETAATPESTLKDKMDEAASELNKLDPAAAATVMDEIVKDLEKKLGESEADMPGSSEMDAAISDAKDTLADLEAISDKLGDIQDTLDKNMDGNMSSDTAQDTAMDMGDVANDMKDMGLTDPAAKTESAIGDMMTGDMPAAKSDIGEAKAAVDAAIADTKAAIEDMMNGEPPAGMEPGEPAGADSEMAGTPEGMEPGEPAGADSTEPGEPAGGEPGEPAGADSEMAGTPEGMEPGAPAEAGGTEPGAPPEGGEPGGPPEPGAPGAPGEEMAGAPGAPAPGEPGAPGAPAPGEPGAPGPPGPPGPPSDVPGVPGTTPGGSDTGSMAQLTGAAGTQNNGPGGWTGNLPKREREAVLAARQATYDPAWEDEVKAYYVELAK